MAPHLVRAQSTYKDMRIHSFHHTHTHAYSDTRTQSQFTYTHTCTHSHTHTLVTLSLVWGSLRESLTHCCACCAASWRNSGCSMGTKRCRRSPPPLWPAAATGVPPFLFSAVRWHWQSDCPVSMATSWSMCGENSTDVGMAQPPLKLIHHFNSSPLSSITKKEVIVAWNKDFIKYL